MGRIDRRDLRGLVYKSVYDCIWCLLGVAYICRKDWFQGIHIYHPSLVAIQLFPRQYGIAMNIVLRLAHVKYSGIIN